jgi:hypothetical protein
MIDKPTVRIKLMFKIYIFIINLFDDCFYVFGEPFRSVVHFDYLALVLLLWF